VPEPGDFFVPSLPVIWTWIRLPKTAGCAALTRSHRPSPSPKYDRPPGSYRGAIIATSERGGANLLIRRARAQAFSQLRPPPPPRDVPHRNGDSLLLSNHHDEPLDGNQPAKFRQRRPIRPFADTNSMENGSPRDFFNRVYFAHFDLNLRKPILE